MQVEYLPVMKPTVREMKYPHEFASRVRSEMAKALGIVCTEHSFLDIKLALAAEKLKQPSGRSLVEFARMEKLFRLDFPTAKEYLEKFSAMDRTHRFGKQIFALGFRFLSKCDQKCRQLPHRSHMQSTAACIKLLS